MASVESRSVVHFLRFVTFSGSHPYIIIYPESLSLARY